MKRLHVNLGVRELAPSVAFYSQLFGAAPTVLKTDYAKWMLDDPRVNFALSLSHGEAGIDHLGIQADDPEEFEELRARVRGTAAPAFEQADAQCCYARSSKAWVRDPNGVSWETFVTHGASAQFGSDTDIDRGLDAAAACCDTARDNQAGACCA